MQVQILSPRLLISKPKAQRLRFRCLAGDFILARTLTPTLLGSRHDRHAPVAHHSISLVQPRRGSRSHSLHHDRSRIARDADRALARGRSNARGRHSDDGFRAGWNPLHRAQWWAAVQVDRSVLAVAVVRHTRGNRPLLGQPHRRRRRAIDVRLAQGSIRPLVADCPAQPRGMALIGRHCGPGDARTPLDAEDRSGGPRGRGAVPLDRPIRSAWFLVLALPGLLFLRCELINASRQIDRLQRNTLFGLVIGLLLASSATRVRSSPMPSSRSPTRSGRSSSGAVSSSATDPPSPEHPYGYGRAEAVASFCVGGLRRRGDPTATCPSMSTRGCLWVTPTRSPDWSEPLSDRGT